MEFEGTPKEMVVQGKDETGKKRRQREQSAPQSQKVADMGHAAAPLPKRPRARRKVIHVLARCENVFGEDVRIAFLLKQGSAEEEASKNRKGNWRKYGQKRLDNDRIRSYYRCNYPG